MQWPDLTNIADVAAEEREEVSSREGDVSSPALMGVGPESPEEAMAVGDEATGFIPPPIDENKACFSPTIL